MQEVVKVSAVETNEKLMAAVEDYFRKGRYDEIAHAIGMHSIMIEPEHMIEDQTRLYRSVLHMIKDRIASALGRRYAAWYADFPGIFDGIVAGGQAVTEKRSADMLASHRAAVGPFKSVDDFYAWALDDRRLTLSEIVKCLEKTAELQGK